MSFEISGSVGESSSTVGGHLMTRVPTLVKIMDTFYIALLANTEDKNAILISVNGELGICWDRVKTIEQEYTFVKNTTAEVTIKVSS